MRYFLIILSLAFSTVTDIDGNVYQTVQIGDQLWMAKSLRVTHYNDGTDIIKGNNENWEDINEGAYIVPYYEGEVPTLEEEIEFSEIYGNLYNWHVVDDGRDICPEGWHIPSDEEFMQLEIFLGMTQESADSIDCYRGINEGSKLAGNAELWNDGGIELDEEFGLSGFIAVPAGYQNNSGRHNIGYQSFFWTSSLTNETYDGSTKPIMRYLQHWYPTIYRSYLSHYIGIPIRCLTNEFNEGCTNPDACNYNPEANIDDGSCTGPYLCDDLVTLECDLGNCPIIGCTDENANNYNSEATLDDGSCVFGQVIHVPQDYATIYLGLYNASENDTVLVQPNTYYENILWPETNGIKLISAGDTSNTIIDGSGIASVITINPQITSIDSTTLIQGFRITNGGDAGFNQVFGGGVYISSASPKLEQLLISNNSAYKGGGIYISQSACIINNVVISNNYAESWGGGIYIGGWDNDEGDFYSRLTNLIIQNNIASTGGGIYQSSSGVTLIDLVVQGNSTTYDCGGGIFTKNGHSMDEVPTYSNLLIINNFSNGAGGGFCCNSGNCNDLSNCKIIGNTSNNDGGGAYFNITTNVHNSIFAYNMSEGNGGAITLSNEFNNYSTFTNTNIINNFANENGDGIYRTTLTSVSNVNFINNSNAWEMYNNIYFIDAPYNYWGHESGPYHANQNPNGQGDSISFYSNIIPWLTEANIEAPPISPQSVNSTEISSNYIILDWEESLSSDVIGYKIHYDTDSGYPYANHIDVGDNLSHLLQGLTGNTAYFIGISCYDNEENESWYSQEIEVLTEQLCDDGLVEFEGECFYPASLGDVNQDNTLDILDVVTGVYIILDVIEYTNYQQYLLDYNQDGNSNILDITALVNYILAE